MEYQEIQRVSLFRSINGLEAAKIVDIRENNLILKRRNGQTQSVPMHNSAEFKRGDFVDAVFYNSGSGRIVGSTPPEFCPDRESAASRFAIASAQRNTSLDTGILGYYR